MLSITPVILSGGAGSRLWPLSTHAMPKQFHALHGDETMFAATLARVLPKAGLDFSPVIVVCGIDHMQPVCAELERANMVNAQVILEPMPRNTAPAIAAAALFQAQSDGEQLMLVLPADHVISSPEVLHQACVDAQSAARLGRIVTFAIKPTGPETGYGYIKSGEALCANVFEVATFAEKPDLATAEAYLADGQYSWNAGIFYFKANALIQELELYAPDVLAQAREALKKSVRQDGIVTLDSTEFAKAPSISIDYAVMEPTSRAAVVAVDMGWSDVGSFAALWELAQKDAAGNVTKGQAAIFNSTNCFVNSQNIPVALIGVSDLVVISTAQGILIAHRDSAQDVRLAAKAFPN